MSGNDERLSLYHACGCHVGIDKKYWYVKNRRDVNIFYVNSFEYISGDEERKIHRINTNPNKLINDSTCEEALEKISYFKCSACNERVVKTSRNGMKIVEYVKSYWNDRSFGA